jgi:hypothetical protein
VTAKELRDRLFKKGRPRFRKAELVSQDGYGKDMKILWAAYKAGSFEAPKDMTQELFADWVMEQAKVFRELWIGEDRSIAFQGGIGPVVLVGMNQENLLVNAVGQSFKWATKRNILRLSVAFLHMVTLSKKTGVCMVKADSKSQKLADHMKDYRLLFYVGKTGNNEYLYAVRGRGS